MQQNKQSELESDEKDLESYRKIIGLNFSQQALLFESFLFGLSSTSEIDKSQYISRWVNFFTTIKDTTSRYKETLCQLFLLRFSWQIMDNESFFNFAIRFSQMGTNPLSKWIEQIFKPIVSTHPDKTIFEKQMVLLTEWLNICESLQVESQVKLPNSLSASYNESFQDYLQRAIFALTQCSVASRQKQAEHLDQLPKLQILNKAFKKGLPFVSGLMLDSNLNKIRIRNIQTLLEENDYRSFKPQAVTYLAMQTKIDFELCLRFFSSLDKLKTKKLNSEEKLLVAKIFIQSICTSKVNDVPYSAFILQACKLKEITSTGFMLLFGNSNTTQNSGLSDYVFACQLWQDLHPSIQVEQHFNKAKNLAQFVTNLQIEQNKLFVKKFPEKPLETVISAFTTQSEFVQFPLSLSEVQQLAEDYRSIEKFGSTLRKMSKEELAKQVRLKGSWLYRRPDCKATQRQLVAMICAVIRLHFKVSPYNTQVLALLAQINKPAGSRGRVAQIRTGEGKSIITAMQVIYIACQGYDRCIDVTTSSESLALRDWLKFKPLYDLFGITSSLIAYAQQEPHHFDVQVLVGTNHNFHFPLLRDKLYQTKLRYYTVGGKLVPRVPYAVVVDEADSFFLQESGSSRLDSPNPNSNVWICEPTLDYVKSRGVTFKIVGESIAELQKILMGYENGKYRDQVRTFSNKRLIHWLQSAYKALYVLKINTDYVKLWQKVSTAKGEQFEQTITIMNRSETGHKCVGMRWSRLLHQMVELLNGITPKNDGLTIASISNTAFFNLYPLIIAFTGTIGTKQERYELEKIFRLGNFDVPPHFENKRMALPGWYLTSKTAWHDKIESDVKWVASKNRPSLVLVETITDSVEISETLHAKQHKHKLINAMQAEDEVRIIDNAGKRSAITVGTNTVTRGVDILLTEESINNGGLHAVLSSWSNNLRIFNQRIGRVARQGQPGSYRTIVHSDDEVIKELIPNPAIRSRLTSDNFEIVLNKLTKLKTIEDSNARMHRSVLEMAYYQIFISFTDLLQTCSEALESLPLSAIVERCKHIKENDIIDLSSFNSLISSSMREQAIELLSQQMHGTQVDWLPFLNRAKAEFLDCLRNEWRVFFNDIEEIASEYSSGKSSDKTLQVKFLQNKFFEFTDRNLKKFTVWPSFAFLQMLCHILRIDSQFLAPCLPKKPTTECYLSWQVKVQQTWRLEAEEAEKLCLPQVEYKKQQQAAVDFRNDKNILALIQRANKKIAEKKANSKAQPIELETLSMPALKPAAKPVSQSYDSLFMDPLEDFFGPINSASNKQRNPVATSANLFDLMDPLDDLFPPADATSKPKLKSFVATSADLFGPVESLDDLFPPEVKPTQTNSVSQPDPGNKNVPSLSGNSHRFLRPPTVSTKVTLPNQPMDKNEKLAI